MFFSRHAGDLATLVPLHAGEGPNGGEGGRRERMSDESMSPTGDRDRDERGRGEIEDDDDDDNNGARDGPAMERDRHRSADIRAQFFADLKRLGGNLPPPPPPPPGPPAQETPETAKASTSSPPPSISTTTAKGQYHLLIISS